MQAYKQIEMTGEEEDTNDYYITKESVREIFSQRVTEKKTTHDHKGGKISRILQGSMWKKNDFVAVNHSYWWGYATVASI